MNLAGGQPSGLQCRWRPNSFHPGGTDWRIYRFATIAALVDLRNFIPALFKDAP